MSNWKIKSEITETIINISLFDDLNQQKGLMRLEIYFSNLPWQNVNSYMLSTESNKGIPRALLTEATKQLKKYALIRKTTLVHNVSFQTSVSREKLPKLFEEFNYTLVEQQNTTYPQYVKVYQ
ncbi:MAG: hypothetical protein AB7V77_04510 [Candidatus Woesearchaeota archaeon]